MIYVVGEDGGQVPAAEDEDEEVVEHSRRAVPVQRFA